jgi:ornithine carbamoyltransferase
LTRHLLEITDLTAPEINRLLDDAERIRLAPQNVGTPLAGKLLGLVFEKPSLRTRASFESAAVRLGGASLFFSGSEVNLGVRETYEDFARVFSQYVDAMVLRVFSHATVVAVARAASVPVINGLSDLAHPCQALADLLTIRQEFGTLAGKTVAFIGDGNNVARSLAFGCALVGARVVLARPEGYGFAGEVPAEETTDARAAVRAADVIYSDVWTTPRLRPVSGECRPARGRPETRPRDALPARAPRRRDHRRSPRRPALPGDSPGRQPHVRPGRPPAMAAGEVRGYVALIAPLRVAANQSVLISANASSVGHTVTPRGRPSTNR